MAVRAVVETYEDPLYWEQPKLEQKHYFMPLQWINYFELTNDKVLDVGCGPGHR